MNSTKKILLFYKEKKTIYDSKRNGLANNTCCVLIRIIPQLQEHSAFQTMIWQQDGAPPHYGQIVRDYLDDTFLQWIGRRGTVEWPPRSPDLTPCDFSLWGIIKDRVYAQQPRNVNHLKLLIEQEFTSLNNNIELCKAICRSVADRCQMCINTEGKQFEHLL